MARQPLLTLTREDFADLLDVPPYTVPNQFDVFSASGDFAYRVPDESVQIETCMRIMEEIARGIFSKAGPARISGWESAWGEILANYRLHPTREALIPGYLVPKPDALFRLRQRFIKPLAPHFALRWYEVLLTWLFQQYAVSAPAVYEFGCGTGFNLSRVLELYPAKTCVGLDWSRSSNDLLNEIGKNTGCSLTGRYFDLFAPDAALELVPGSVVLTVGALEQIGKECAGFLNYLASQPVAFCIHIEPVLEWYDARDPVDQTAIAFHKNRGYLEGLLPVIWSLVGQGKARIVKLSRSFFGSMYIESYSILIWRPVQKAGSGEL